MAIIGKDIKIAQQHLQNADVIGIPTETVYGLAANALNDSAIAKIFEVKNRPTSPINMSIINYKFLSQAFFGCQNCIYFEGWWYLEVMYGVRVCTPNTGGG